MNGAFRGVGDTNSLDERAGALVVLEKYFPGDDARLLAEGATILDKVIVEVLAYRSARTTALTVYRRLRQRFPCWRDLIEAPASEVAEIVSATGLARYRAEILRKLVTRIYHDYPDGGLEDLRGWNDTSVLRYLETLPGVGAFVALELMLVAFERPVLPLAWPLGRLLIRLGIAERRSDLDHLLASAATQLAPGRHRPFYEGLLAHARLICKPRLPHCEQCQLAPLCTYYKRSQVMRRAEGWRDQTPRRRRARPGPRSATDGAAREIPPEPPPRVNVQSINS